MEIRPRRRLVYAALIAGTIVLGLLTRGHGVLPPGVGKSCGDMLWALCVYLICGVLWPAAPVRQLAWRALLCACLIEFALLYHAPWLDALRHHRLAGLLLGQTFHWINFPYYLAGIGLGMLGEWGWLRKSR